MKHYIYLILTEILTGIFALALSAALMIPVAFKLRGYFAIGGEWILIFGVAYLGFFAFNEYIFKEKE